MVGHLCYYFLLNLILSLYGNRAGPSKRDPASTNLSKRHLASTNPRSRVTWLGISRINAMTRVGLSKWAVIALFMQKCCK